MLLIGMTALAVSPAASGAPSCADEIRGTEGADTLAGTAGSDRILGLGGNDTLSGAQAADCIDGGPGGDRLNGNAGGDLLRGGDAGDTLQGDAGDDRVLGEAGSDSLSGGAGRDAIDGGAGSDEVHEVGDGYREGETIDVGSNAIDTGPGDDTVAAANGRRDRIVCGAGRDHAIVDHEDRLRGCERRSFLVSPFPQVTPRKGGLKRSFTVEFRSLATTDRRTEFFSIEVRGPSGSACREITGNSIGVTYHRSRTVRYQLDPFTGKGAAAKSWCKGLYRGKVAFVTITKRGCELRDSRPPDRRCTHSRAIGEFAFRVR